MSHAKVARWRHSWFQFVSCLIFFLPNYRVKYDVYLYMNLRRSRDCILTWCVCMFVCLCVSPSLHLLRFGQLRLCADERIVNIMKVYIEWNKMQVELIRFRNKNINSIRVYFHEARNSMHYRSLNATPCSRQLLSGSVYVHLPVVTPLPHCSPFNWMVRLCVSFYYRVHQITLLRYADKRIVSIMEMYIKRNKLKLD